MTNTQTSLSARRFAPILTSSRSWQVSRSKGREGTLSQVGFFHTFGFTPRHFQFDSSGQYLIVANQDSDCLSIFSFNLSSGELHFTGNKYHVPSPNFVQCVGQLKGE